MYPMPLHIVESNCRGALRDAINRLASGRVDAFLAEEICRNYRVLAACSLFRTGMSQGLALNLRRGVAAHLELSAAFDHHPRATQSLPILCDACASGSWRLAETVASGVVNERDATREYEDDFLYCRYLVAAVLAGDVDRSGNVGGSEEALERLTEVLEGEDDRRLDVCTALEDRDRLLFDSAITSYMEQKERDFEERRAEDALDPEEAVTIERISIEGLALVSLAERYGIETRSDYLLIPSLSRTDPTRTAPDGLDWKSAGTTP